MSKLKILILCTGNSCRSQMAEGWFRHLYGDLLDVYSAGIESHGLNQRAVKVMAEAGVDISGHRSKLITELNETHFDLVLTVCDSARENCPWFPGKVKHIHRSFNDPPALTKSLTGEDNILTVYRRVRDEIREYVENFEVLV